MNKIDNTIFTPKSDLNMALKLMRAFIAVE